MSSSFQQALAHHRNGNLDAALQDYEALRAATEKIGFKECYFPALAYMQSGQYQRALQLLNEGLAIEPKNAQALFQRGNVLASLGHEGEALDAYESALKEIPHFLDALLNKSGLLSRLGRHSEAIATCDQALTIDPQLYRVLGNKAHALNGLERYQDAIEACNKALKISPLYHSAINNRGLALTKLGRIEDAISDFQNLIKLQPGFAEGYYNLGNALLEKEDYEQAFRAFEKASHLNQSYADALLGMSIALYETGQYEGAKAFIEQSLTLKPEQAEAVFIHAEILNGLDEDDSAQKQYSQVLTLDPNHVRALTRRSRLFQQLGQFEAAKADLQSAHAIDPSSIGPRIGLAMLALDEDDIGNEHISFLLSKEHDVGSIKSSLAIDLHYALGRIHDKLKNYDQAILHRISAGKLKLEKFQEPQNNTVDRFHVITSTLTRDWIDKRRGYGNPSNLPIFIVGMPRSGTTLTEAILSSHHKISGAGELKDFAQISKDYFLENNPTGLETISDHDIRKIGDHYIERLQRHFASAIHITDKMPWNFSYIGLIYLALPNAKIIHIQREPIDNCLSMFEQNFAHGHRFSYDLKETGLQYRAYHDLMRHWRNVLPENAVMDIRYEDLVADPERVTRAMLQYCELEWDPNCLNYQTSERRIKTASILQVRKPIYQTSVEKWRRYEAHLAPLIEALGDLAPKSI